LITANPPVNSANHAQAALRFADVILPVGAVHLRLVDGRPGGAGRAGSIV
jgi:hypothetical protein